jgi:hypothetical protein
MWFVHVVSVAHELVLLAAQSRSAMGAIGGQGCGRDGRLRAPPVQLQRERRAASPRRRILTVYHWGSVPNHWRRGNHADFREEAKRIRREASVGELSCKG